MQLGFQPPLEHQRKTNQHESLLVVVGEKLLAPKWLDIGRMWLFYEGTLQHWNSIFSKFRLKSLGETLPFRRTSEETWGNIGNFKGLKMIRVPLIKN